MSIRIYPCFFIGIFPYVELLTQKLVTTVLTSRVKKCKVKIMRTRLWLYLLSSVSGFVLWGCSLQQIRNLPPDNLTAGQEEIDLPPSVADMRVVDGSTFNYGEAPDNCQPEAVAMRVAELFQAINNKEINRLSTWFSAEEAYSFVFMWKATPEPEEQLNFFDLKNLSQFLNTRYAQNESLILTDVFVNYWEPRNNTANFNYHGHRMADDLPDQNIIGKGMLYCQSNTFAAIGVGPDTIRNNE